MVKNVNLTRSANSKFAKLNESANSRNANPRLLNLEIISIHLDHLYKWNIIFTSNFLITKKTISKFVLVGFRMSISIRM